MQKPKLVIVALFLLAASTLHAQHSELIRNYITTYKQVAIEEMIRTGVPASIKLAQGIFETTAGTSKLVMQSSNHFGIKCKSSWTGESVKHDDDLKAECFRKYPSALDSYKDHSDFLKNNSRYAFLFSLDPTDYRGWALGLKKAGYATNSKYPQALIKLIEDYNLQDYTLLAMGKTVPGNSAIIAAVSSEPVIDEKTIVQPVITRPAYPEGEFKIHDTKVVFVTKGSSYLAIAKKYDVDLSKLFEFNDIPRSEQADKDQLVYLQRKRKTGKSEFHIVQPGETLHDIAQQEGIRLESLRELNWLKENDIPGTGEQLSLQKKSSTMPKLAIKEKYTLVPTNNRLSRN